jgi:hypothetical protein
MVIKFVFKFPIALKYENVNYLGTTIGHLFVDAFARPNEKSELCIGTAGRG